MPGARLIYTDIPGSLPAEYIIPPDLDLEISSVYARINGAGASGSFRPCLTVLSQDDRVIARVPLDETYAVADTGDATWSPFLRTPSAGAASTSAFTMIKRSERVLAAPQVVGAGAWVTVDISQATLTNQSPTRFGTSADALEVKLNGRYGFLGKIRWDPLFVGNASLSILASGVWAYGPTVTYNLPGPGADIGNAMLIYLESDIPGGTTQFSLLARQESGANQTIEGAMFQITYLGPFTNPGSDYDDF